jgi:ABC-2 type transport system permease protein
MNLAANWHKFKTLYSVWLSHMLIYRAELVVWMLSGTVPWLMMVVWIGKAQTEGGSVAGFSAADFGAYFMAVWLTNQAVVAWVAWELDFQIRQGELSPKLLRPLDPVWEYWFRHLTEKSVRIPMAIPLAVAGLALVPGALAAFTPNLGAFLLFLLSLVLAANMRFFAAYCIGILCFWTDQATAIDDFWFFLAVFAGGIFAPLTLYPQWAQDMLQWTPWPYITYYPVQILNGALTGPAVLRVLLIEAAWLLFFWLLSRVAWHSGLRRYGAVGA